MEQEVNIKSMRINNILSEDYIEPNLKNDILLELGPILDKTNKVKENKFKKNLNKLQKINNNTINKNVLLIYQTVS